MKLWLALSVGLCVAAPLTLWAQTPTAPPAQRPANPNPPAAVKAAPKPAVAPAPANPARNAVGPTVGKPRDVSPSEADARAKTLALLKHALQAPRHEPKYGLPPDTVPNDNDLILLDGMPQYLVPLGRLASYTGQDPKLVLLDQQREIIPVSFKGNVFVSITITQHGDAWKPAAFGSAQLIRALVYAQGIAEQRLQASATNKLEYRVVTISGLNRTFLGVELGGVLQLIPIVTDARLKHEQGVAKPAVEVLKSLVSDANALNGLPT